MNSCDQAFENHKPFQQLRVLEKKISKKTSTWLQARFRHSKRVHSYQGGKWQGIKNPLHDGQKRGVKR